MDERLKEIRKKIDLIDHGIMELLHERMELSLRSKSWKKKTTDPNREEQVLSNVTRLAQAPITAEFSRKLYLEIIGESKRIQDAGKGQAREKETKMKIAIMGLGRMGSWLARELSKHHELAVMDSDPAKLDGITGMTVLREPVEIQHFKPDFLVNAVTLEKTIEVLDQTLKYLPKECIISDMASIKGALGTYYEQCGLRFVSVHPMFGPTFADMDRLRGESVIIISESDPQGAAFVRGFFEHLGVAVLEYSFVEHDRMMAYSLTLPFISSMAFASCVDRTAVPGTTFAKHMNIARGLLAEDDGLLGEILFNAYSLPELNRVTGMMEYLKHIIQGKDREVLGDFLNTLRKNIA